MTSELFKYIYNGSNFITKSYSKESNMEFNYFRYENCILIEIKEIELINIFDRNLDESLNESIELSGKSCFLDPVYAFKDGAINLTDKIKAKLTCNSTGSLFKVSGGIEHSEISIDLTLPSSPYFSKLLSLSGRIKKIVIHLNTNLFYIPEENKSIVVEKNDFFGSSLSKVEIHL